MAEDIFIVSHNAVSHRKAVLEDDGKVAYLYLTGPDTDELERDAIVYMRVPPIDRGARKRLRAAQSTPLLLQELASDTAVIKNPTPREFSLAWSRDGIAVAVLHLGVALAMIDMTERFGYSRAVAKPSPFGYPWDQARYEMCFKK